VTGHIFISYSHSQDRGYAERLAAYLASCGHRVWFDKEIIQGDRWPQAIRTNIDSCAAFIVVMTPEAERSEWVEKEIDQAHHTSRPILPLLLRGARFFTLANVQYEDVTGGRMPSPNFMQHLRMIAPAQQVSWPQIPGFNGTTHSPTGLPGPLFQSKPIGKDRTTLWGQLAVATAGLPILPLLFSITVLHFAYFANFFILSTALSVVFGILSTQQARRHRRKPRLAYVAFLLDGIWLALVVTLSLTV